MVASTSIPRSFLVLFFFVCLAIPVVAQVVSVTPTVETEPVPSSDDAADDPAIWVHPTDPSLSAIIGTDKDSGLAVYDLAGNQIQFLALGEANNVDVRYNFPLGTEFVDIVAFSNRSNDTIGVYKVNPQTRQLEDVAARAISTGNTVYGFCLYHSPLTGKYFGFVTAQNGQVEQWELFDNGSGLVDGTLRRTLSVGGQTEGCVADDEYALFYVGEELVGIWRYGAEPDAGSVRTMVDTTGGGGRLTADVEGLSIYYANDGTGYLIASSQGSSEYVVYRREGTNDYVMTFTIGSGNGIDAVTGADGIDVLNFPLDSTFPLGVFVSQDDSNDGGNQNYKLVPWESIANAVVPPLTIDLLWDPRDIGDPTPPVLVTVPDVVGLPQAQATTQIVEAELVVGTITTAPHSSIQAGNVISQSPEGGTSVPSGSSVGLEISEGPANFIVPNVVGQAQATAEANIVAALLTVGSVTFANDAIIPAGNVVSQNPAAGSNVTEGTAINIVVSLGVAPQAVSLLDNWVVDGSYATQDAVFNVSPGINRLVVVAVSAEKNDNGPMAVEAVRLGDQVFTEVFDFTVGSSTAYHNLHWVGYLLESQIAARTGSTLTITYANAPSNPFDEPKAHYASFAHVDQTTPIGEVASTTNTNTSSLALPQAVTAGEGDQILGFNVLGQPFALGISTAGYTEATEAIGPTNGHASATYQRAATTAATELLTFTAATASRMAVSALVLKAAVIDTDKPVITLAGPNLQLLERGTAYPELGATANDPTQGDLTADIVIDASAVDSNTVGSYPVTYNVTDGSGNVADEVTRTVTVEDTTAPVITLVGANPQPLEVDNAYPELGATATDLLPGDLTNAITIDASAVNITTEGDYPVTYNVTDGAGNPAVEVTRIVQVRLPDTDLPTITLVGGNPQIVERGTAYIELGATANDPTQGDLTASMVIDASAVNSTTVGSYPVTYNVSDGAGNPAPEVTRTVTVQDTLAPVITLQGENPQVLVVGTAYTELGATATDLVPGDLTSAIVIDASAVDSTTVGSYPVTYNVSDGAGNPAVQVIRTVQVIGSPPPPPPAAFFDNFDSGDLSGYGTLGSGNWSTVSEAGRGLVLRQTTNANTILYAVGENFSGSYQVEAEIWNEDNDAAGVAFRVNTADADNFYSCSATSDNGFQAGLWRHVNDLTDTPTTLLAGQSWNYVRSRWYTVTITVDNTANTIHCQWVSAEGGVGLEVTAVDPDPAATGTIGIRLSSEDNFKGGTVEECCVTIQ